MTHPHRCLPLIVLLALAACTGSQQPETDETNRLDEPASPRIESAALAEQKTASDVVVGYLALKNALVASDAEGAKARAVDLLGIVDATRMPNVQQRVKEMAASTDLEVQRTYFDSLSVALYEQVKQQATVQQTLYKQYCPMAFNDRGAFWLSANREIENPYFGDKMMKCGRIEEEISSK
ncbi:MAG: DUF3347 domain-containing protein [Tunicatimonas sp.]